MKIIVCIIMLFSLSGCATYGLEFECQAGKGVGCKSISQVNDMVNKNELEALSEAEAVKEVKARFNYQHGNAPAPKKVKRIPERTARVWINGFTDPKGDYVDETYVYTVLASGQWEEIR